jgi:hypothetical protein
MKNWRDKLTLAAVTGLISGVVRAVTAHILDSLLP